MTSDVKLYWLSERKHGTFDSIPYEQHGAHYLGLLSAGWRYYFMDDFGDAVPSGGFFQCL
mgnify:CR=1 FL=1